MEFFKKFWDKIKNPKILWLVLFYIAFVLITTGTILLVVLVPNQTVFHYVLYFLSALALTYFVYTIVICAPKMKAGIIKKLKKYKLTRIMLSNYGYRTIMFSFLSFILNVAYVVFIGVFGILSRSEWYISIASYYLILSLTKGSVIYNRKKNNTRLKQAKVYRYCGIMLIMLTFVLSGILVLIYTTDMSFKYAGIMLYAVAAYTFYYLILAIYNFFKARKYDDLFIQSTRNINLAKSLVSVIVLQVAMFHAFSPENQTSIANAITGLAISVLILIVGIFMIIKANKILKNKELSRVDINVIVEVENEKKESNSNEKIDLQQTKESDQNKEQIIEKENKEDNND
ncbi:MAG: hypothetical protein IJW32_00195 [Clostridia bacterium]|nr:hypothetical protein [Clostridia bacterium]